MSDQNSQRKKMQTYQSLAHADDVAKIFDGRPESLLHVTTEENSAWGCQVAQSSNLKKEIKVMFSMAVDTLSEMQQNEKESAIPLLDNSFMLLWVKQEKSFSSLILVCF